MAWADLENRVTDTAISRFGVTALYDGGVNVAGVFDSGFYSVLVGEDADLETKQITFFCQSSDVYGLVYGKSFLIDSVYYTAIGIEPDGEGAVLIRLEVASGTC